MWIRSLLAQFRPSRRLYACKLSNSGALNVRRSVGGGQPEDVREDPNFEPVMKILQRFERDPAKYSDEDKPFAMIDRKFLGKVMHIKELTPERGFSNIVPFGFMFFRHANRAAEAKAALQVFKDDGLLNENDIKEGTKVAFELIAQNAHKDTLDDLVKRGVCGEQVVQRFTAAGSQMSQRQRELLNLTQEDIYAIAPGPYGHFQILKPKLFEGKLFMTYSILCCALYKKKMLFEAVRSLPLLSPEDRVKSDFLKMPSGYGYTAPRTIFGFITFGNEIVNPKEHKVDPDVRLLDFQFIVM